MKELLAATGRNHIHQASSLKRVTARRLCQVAAVDHPMKALCHAAPGLRGLSWAPETTRL